MRKIDGKKKDFLDQEIGYSKYVVNTDKLDIRFFEEVKENSPDIKKILEEAQGDYEQFGELQQDIFSALYRYKPHRLKEHQINPAYLLNHYIIGDVMDSSKYKTLRAQTRLDRINSTVGTEVLGHEAHEAIKSFKEQQKKLEELLKAQQAVDNAKKAVNPGAKKVKFHNLIAQNGP